VKHIFILNQEFDALQNFNGFAKGPESGLVFYKIFWHQQIFDRVSILGCMPDINPLILQSCNENSVPAGKVKIFEKPYFSGLAKSWFSDGAGVIYGKPVDIWYKNDIFFYDFK
jgi:hypothetical protein